MILKLENKEIAISKEELDDINKFIKNIDSVSEFQVYVTPNKKELHVIRRYDNGWSKNWLLYIVHTDGKKITRISKNNPRQACEHDESVNYWTTIYKRHLWN